MKKLLTMIAAAVVAVGANAEDIIYGPDAYGLTWTNQIISGTKVKLVGESSGKTAAFDAANIPWTFTVDGTKYTVDRVGNSALKSWSKLTGDLALPDTVTYVDSLEGTGIKSLSIGSGVTSFSGYWAKNADSLEFLVVPSTVTSIGVQFVFGCDRIKALWIQGPATVASGTQTYTSFNGDKAIVECSSLETVLFGPNTKWTAGSDKYIDSNSKVSAKLFVPENGYWSGLKTYNAEITVIKYGAGQELDIAIDKTAGTLTATPTTEHALTNVLASAANFKKYFGLDTVISITNDIAASVEITTDMLNDVKLNVPTWYMTFAVKTQAQLDRVLAATTGPIVADITDATEEITPPVGRRVAILAPGGAAFKYYKRGLIISFH